MTSSSIDFTPLPQEADIPVRKSFRVPVSREDNVHLLVGQKPYTAVNLSASGIAVHAKSCLEFEAGQILENAVLTIGATQFANLTGKVVHCSVLDTGELHFGIQWQKMAPEILEEMCRLLEKIKDRALKADGGPGEEDRG